MKKNKGSKKKVINKEVDKPAKGKMKIAHNFILLAVTFFLITQLKSHNRGYEWVFDTLVKGGLASVKKYEALTEVQKMEAKLGYTGSYFNYINKQTPDTAIIIMPPKETLQTKGKKIKLDRYITGRHWSNYFVYPRKFVYEDEKENFPVLYKKATHVAIMYAWGYHLLDYQVEGKVDFTVLPIKRNK